MWLFLNWFLACSKTEAEKAFSYPDIELSKERLDFGVAVPGTVVTETLTIRNIGDATLHLGNPFFVGEGGQFSVSALSTTTLIPNSSTDLVLSYDPAAETEMNAVLVLLSDDPDEPSLQVRLLSHTQSQQLWFDPPFTDFGTLLVDCPAEEEVHLHNGGATAVDVNVLDTGSINFHVDPMVSVNGPLPWTLEPGADFPLSISYDSSVSGTSSSTLRALDGRQVLAETQMTGTRLTDPHTEEVFPLGGGSVDIVIPIQDAGGQTDIVPFRDGFPDFLDTLDKLDVDYQIAVVQEADGCAYGSSPFFSASMNRNDQLAILDEQLNGTSLAHGLVVASEAVKESKSAPGGCNEGLVRDTARLAIFAYTFVGENHPDYGWKLAVDQIVARKEDSADVTINGIIEDLVHGCGWGSHSFWSDAVVATGGVWYSICDDVPSNMLKVASTLAQPETKFTLSYEPVEESIEVRISGAVTQAWTYYRSSRVLSLDTVPTSSGEVSISYDIVNTCGQ